MHPPPPAVAALYGQPDGRDILRAAVGRDPLLRHLAPKASSGAPPAVPAFDDWLEEEFPAWRWDWPHLVRMRESLARVTAGNCRRLMIFLPPRSGKSEQTTIRYPVWRLLRDPGTRVCVGCYNQRFAERFGRRSRRIAERFGLISASSKTRRAAMEWETEGGGVYRSCGVGSVPMGEGFTLLLIDDFCKSREEAESDAYRQRAWEWYGDLYTRREPGAAIVIVTTRWHTDDLPGRLLARATEGGDPWEVVSLPALAEEEDPLGRTPGEALCPERFTAEELLQTREVIGPYSFASEYQQAPTAPGGNLFQVGAIRSLPETLPALRLYQGWDLAISLKSGADYSCCATVGVDDQANLYLLDMARGRWTFNETLERMKVQAESFRPVAVAIEATAYQSAAFEEASRRYLLPFRAVRPDKDKVIRAQLLAARIAAGRVYGNRQAPWWPAWEKEAMAFPAGAHDDQVDAACYAAAEAASPPAVGSAPEAPGLSWFETERDVSPY